MLIEGRAMFVILMHIFVFIGYCLGKAIALEEYEYNLKKRARIKFLKWLEKQLNKEEVS